MEIPSEMTLGNKIDNVVTRINDLPASYLTGTFVCVSVIIAFVVLNIGGKEAEVEYDPTMMNKQFSKSSKHVKKNEDEPQPKWHVLKILNVAASAGFLFSVLKFLSNASTYLSDSTSLIKFLSAWSMFCLYFFGFFGISFINPDEFDQEVASTTRSKKREEPKTRRVIHPPAACTPVCSDVGSKSVALIENVKESSDSEIATMVNSGKVKDHTLEKLL
eukprot:CAMPEP_0197840692 /NCGR_PEP_ID=MMETSP1437-20131217/45747_1 /TAXON_ID=49252 ORGANISM="Eucampia antarctica, Strain CCMP1452" /NCGR_SAMPLE_ID=MMETSP1437 /ASSEMBLY_ACC=CAM_ASM_001096 /LENGTH=217 /DNA_ID=CAMNT_0043450333 /DNA_START=71 /DNA_END=724 /DNA_ORIENTATION=-